MQTMQLSPRAAARPVTAIADRSALSPLAMALHLRAAEGDAAFCFARVMHEGSAWANEDWGRYWADVMRLV